VRKSLAASPEALGILGISPSSSIRNHIFARQNCDGSVKGCRSIRVVANFLVIHAVDYTGERTALCVRAFWLDGFAPTAFPTARSAAMAHYSKWLVTELFNESDKSLVDGVLQTGFKKIKLR
jgi:hypothetical protein